MTRLCFDMQRPWDRAVPAGLRRTVSVTIENHTAWLNRDLAKIVRRVVAIEELPPGHLTVRVVYGRGGGGCSGYAGYRSWRLTVRVPSAAALAKWSAPFPRVDFAHVVAHEIGHAVWAKKHREMGFHYRRGPYSDKVFAWAKDLTVRPKAAPKKPTLDTKRARELKRAGASVAKYERRIKLDQTLLKKWKRRVRVLERRMAVLEVAAEKPGGEPCMSQTSDPQTSGSETRAASSC